MGVGNQSPPQTIMLQSIATQSTVARFRPLNAVYQGYECRRNMFSGELYAYPVNDEMTCRRIKANTIDELKSAIESANQEDRRVQAEFLSSGLSFAEFFKSEVNS